MKKLFKVITFVPILLFGLVLMLFTRKNVMSILDAVIQQPEWYVREYSSETKLVCEGPRVRWTILPMDRELHVWFKNEAIKDLFGASHVIPLRRSESVLAFGIVRHMWLTYGEDNG